MRFYSFIPVFAVFCMVCGHASYAQTNTGQPVLYNQNAVPFSLSQAVAGVSAPSYSYNAGSTQTYAPQGTLSPEQEAALEAQYFQQQALFQQQLNQQAALAAQNNQSSLQDPNSFQAQLARLRAGGASSNDAQPTERKVKRVVRNAINNPLQPPPRLFNPDQ